MLALLFILGMLCPLNFAVIPISLLDPASDGVLASRLPNSFLLKLPDCTNYGSKSVDLLYSEAGSTENKTEPFFVPPCPVTQFWYVLKNLKSGTAYNMQYIIANETSQTLTETTASVNDFQQINDGLQARSGAMVVITVILSLAMVILLAGLIVILFFSG